MGVGVGVYISWLLGNGSFKYFFFAKLMTDSKCVFNEVLSKDFCLF